MDEWEDVVAEGWLGPEDWRAEVFEQERVGFLAEGDGEAHGLSCGGNKPHSAKVLESALQGTRAMTHRRTSTVVCR